jgi:hypothetical protein
MFEFMMIFLGAMPFIIGLYAIRTIRKGNNRGSDDPPPPPDPAPPRPVLPPAPEPRRVHTPVRPRLQRSAVKHGTLRTTDWRKTVRREIRYVAGHVIA